MGKLKETNAYLASVEYYDETTEMINDQFQTDGIDYVVMATSYADAEAQIIESVTEALFVKIYNIEMMDAVPLF